MLFPSCSRILLFSLLSSPHGLNKVVLEPSCIWIRCTRASSWYSNGPFNSDLVETIKTNAFNAFVLDRIIGPFGTCNGFLLVFMGWSTSSHKHHLKRIRPRIKICVKQRKINNIEGNINIILTWKINLVCIINTVQPSEMTQVRSDSDFVVNTQRSRFTATVIILNPTVGSG